MFPGQSTGTSPTKSIDPAPCDAGIYLGHVSVSARASENISMNMV